MLADDFTPQQICVYLKVCTDSNKPKFVPIDGGDIRKSFSFEQISSKSSHSIRFYM